MKRKSNVSIFSLIILLTLVLSPEIFAANQWYTCEVVATRVGASGDTLIRLTHLGVPSAFKNKWVRAPKNVRREMIALSLSGLATGFSVRVSLDLQSTGTPLINSFMLNNN